MRKELRNAHPDRVKEHYRVHSLLDKTKERKLLLAREHKDEINARRRTAWANRRVQQTIGGNPEPVTEMAQESL